MNRPSLFVAAAILCASCVTTPKSATGEPEEPAESEAAVSAPPAPAQAEVPFRPLKSPAVRTVLIPVPNKPVVSFRLVFHTGSVDDPRGKEGLTSLTTSLLEQGGTRSLTSSQLIDALFPIAGELYAYTDKELTTFVGRIHQDKLEPFLKIFGDVLLEPRFDPVDFNRVKADALNNVRNDLRSENDEALGKVALDALLFQDHPYRHFSGGTVKGLQAITLDDVKEHWKKVFTQDRLVVGLAGAVDEALKKRVMDRLAGLPATGAPRVELPPVPQEGGRAIIVQKDALSTAISIGHAYDLRRGDPDYFAVAAALSMLGEHRQFHGVLFNELREKRGLNYGDYAYAEHFIQEGGSTFTLPNIVRSQQDFTLWLRPVEPPHAVFATRGALYYLKELLDKPIPADRFEVGRGFLQGYTHLWEATDQRRLGYAIDGLLYGTPNFLESYRQALKTLTPAQVHQAVRKHLSLEKLNFAYVTRDAKGLAEALHHQKPSPIEYTSPKAAEILETDKAIIGFPLPISPEKIQVVPVDQLMEQ